MARLNIASAILGSFMNSFPYEDVYMPYEAGDVVIDLESGLRMTVVSHTLDGVECTWFEQCKSCHQFSGAPRSALFLPRQLMKFEMKTYEAE